MPETPGGSRNWDYRYSWVRDSTFALWGLYTLGLDREANDFFAFIQDVAHDQLQVLYGVGGELRLDESRLDHLSGYEGARPVRIGNAAYGQRQHDVWGAVLDSVWVHAKSREVRGVDRVVIRDGEAIGEMLRRMGATTTVELWEERRARREVSDLAELRSIVERHLAETGSPRAAEILGSWDEYLPRFLKVMPVGYKLLLEQESE